MFDSNSIAGLATILETTEVSMFGNAEQDAAANRVNAVVARMLRSGCDYDTLSVSEKVHFMTDTVLVGEGMLHMLKTNDAVRSQIMSMGGQNLLDLSIEVRTKELEEARTILVDLKQQLQ